MCTLNVLMSERTVLWVLCVRLCGFYRNADTKCMEGGGVIITQHSHQWESHFSSFSLHQRLRPCPLTSKTAVPLISPLLFHLPFSTMPHSLHFCSFLLLVSLSTHFYFLPWKHTELLLVLLESLRIGLCAKWCWQKIKRGQKVKRFWDVTEECGNFLFWMFHERRILCI